MPSFLVTMQNTKIRQVIIIIVEILVINHSFMAFVFLCVVRNGCVVCDVGDDNHAGDMTDARSNRDARGSLETGLRS